NRSRTACPAATEGPDDCDRLQLARGPTRSSIESVDSRRHQSPPIRRDAKVRRDQSPAADAARARNPVLTWLRSHVAHRRKDPVAQNDAETSRNAPSAAP